MDLAREVVVIMKHGVYLLKRPSLLVSRITIENHPDKKFIIAQTDFVRSTNMCNFIFHVHICIILRQISSCGISLLFGCLYCFMEIKYSL